MSRFTSGTSDTRRAWPLLAAVAALAAPCPPAVAGAQDNKPQSTGQAAGQIVSQPVRDVGIEKTKVPPLLASIGDDPYAMRGAGTCRQIASSVAALNDARPRLYRLGRHRKSATSPGRRRGGGR